jgi:hypothetical protein
MGRNREAPRDQRAKECERQLRSTIILSRAACGQRLALPDAAGIRDRSGKAFEALAQVRKLFRTVHEFDVPVVLVQPLSTARLRQRGRWALVTS